MAPRLITGLILAGGRGSRMGGVDNGLQNHRGMPLAMHALLRLGPQVGQLMINANRNLGAYESMGVPVWPDALPDYPGPLAGLLTGLERCETPYLVTVPCDTPNFPNDLVARLAAALVADAAAEIAMAAAPEDGTLRTQPVFCLLRHELLESLVACLHGGQRKFDRWTAPHRCSIVEFESAAAFFNADTLADQPAAAAVAAGALTPPRAAPTARPAPPRRVSAPWSSMCMRRCAYSESRPSSAGSAMSRYSG